MLGSAVSCVLKSQHIKINSTQKTKGPSSDLSVDFDVFLSSLKCEMNTSQGERVYIVRHGSRFWIPTIGTDPQKWEGSGTCSRLVCLSLWLVCL